MKPGFRPRLLLERLVERQIVGHFGPQGLAAAQQVLGHRQRAVDVLGGERLHQAAEGEVGHREARRLAGDEQARHAKIVQPHRDREAGRAVGQMEVEQHQVRIVLLGRGDRAFGILGDRDDPVAGIVLDQIFDGFRKLQIILDDQDPEHPPSLPKPRGNSSRKFRHLMLARIAGVQIPRERG